MLFPKWEKVQAIVSLQSVIDFTFTCSYSIIWMTFVVTSTFPTANFSHRLYYFLPLNMKFAKATWKGMWFMHKTKQKFEKNTILFLSFIQNYIVLSPIKTLSCAKSVIAHCKLPLPCNYFATCYYKKSYYVKRIMKSIDNQNLWTRYEYFMLVRIFVKYSFLQW